jgi:hypothetical protein
MARGRVVFMHLDEALYRDDPPPVVNVSDRASLVAAIRRLQQDPDEMRRLGEAGREWVVSHHSSANHLKLLRNVYALAQQAPEPGQAAPVVPPASADAGPAAAVGPSTQTVPNQ